MNVIYQDIIKVVNLCLLSMFAFAEILKEPVILTPTVSVTPCYILEVYVHLFHKDAKSFRNLTINIHGVFSPHLGTQILKISKLRGRPKNILGWWKPERGGEIFLKSKFHDLTHALGEGVGRGYQNEKF